MLAVVVSLMVLFPLHDPDSRPDLSCLQVGRVGVYLCGAVADRTNQRTEVTGCEALCREGADVSSGDRARHCSRPSRASWPAIAAAQEDRDSPGGHGCADVNVRHPYVRCETRIAQSELYRRSVLKYGSERSRLAASAMASSSSWAPILRVKPAGATIATNPSFLLFLCVSRARKEYEPLPATCLHSEACGGALKETTLLSSNEAFSRASAG